MNYPVCFNKFQRYFFGEILSKGAHRDELVESDD